MPIMKVKAVATLVAVGAWLLVTLSACEQSKRAEIVSVEDIRAEAQQSADTDDTRSGNPPGAIEEPKVSRLEPFDFVPELPPQPRRPDVTVAARTKPEGDRPEPFDFVPEAPPQPRQLGGPVSGRTRDSGLADVFFDFDKYAIRSGAVVVLERNAELLKRTYRHASVLIEGHCDERGSVEYNLALGKRRAQIVKSYLVDLGVEASRIRIVSYGKEKPFCTESTRICRQLNRRAHFVW